MALIKQIVKPVSSLSVGSYTLATDPQSYTQTTPVASTWYPIRAVTFQPEEIKSKNITALDITISGTLSTTSAANSWIRATLNGNPISPKTDNADGRIGVDLTARGFSFTGRIQDYGIAQTLKWECMNTATNQTFTLISNSIDARVLTYV